MILATRSPYVCHIMVADRKVQMVGLLLEEAWELFREQVGEIIDSPNIFPYAQAIVKKCHGLPLLIVVTGRALAKENDALNWMHASRNFLWLSAHGMYGFEGLIQQLKFSYDRLESPEMKSCFLYCVLFPQDRQDGIDKLVEYRIEQGLVVGKWTDSYKRGPVASFKSNQPLILEDHQFLSKASAGLTELPLKEKWEEAKMIFVMDNELSSLPDSPSCPKLLALFLQRNQNLRVIPTSFFDLMPFLTVLNLSKTRIKSLPKSLCKLMSLEVLILHDCERLVQLPSEVGSLRRQEVLDLQETEINKLSNKISELSSLIYRRYHFMALSTGVNMLSCLMNWFHVE
uniref:NBS-LRR protein n=1 Tax=Quercus lobata TaxID=97700 RepID=A0A7N2N8K5_QUELO